MGTYSDETKTKRTPSMRLSQIISTERRDIGVLLIYGAAVGFLSLVVPVAAQSLVNTVTFTSILQPILILTLVVLFMLGFASALRLLQTSVVETIQQRIFARIALDLAYRLPRVRFEVFDQSRGTELVNRFFESLTVQKTLSLLLLDGIAVVLQAGIGLILLAFYHPILLAFDVLLIFSIAAVVVIPARAAIQTSIKESKAKYKMAAWLEELARNPLLFRHAMGPDYGLRRADEIAQEYIVARKSHFRILVWQVGGTLVVQTVASALLLGLGSVLVIQKQLTLGQLVAAEIVVTMVVGGFAKFGKYLETFYDLMASVDKLGQVFDLPLERNSGDKLGESTGPFSLSLQDVSFRYSLSPSSAVHGFSLQVNAGEKIGIDGTNGSGKSTVLDLIAGLRIPRTGAVQVNGFDLRDLDISDFRRHVSFVRKEEIFDGNVIENIRVGRDWIPLIRIREVLAELSLLDDILALTDGLQTNLSGSESPLSAGQTQRLLIARAIVDQPRLLILDEALENIDSKSKSEILRLISATEAPWTLILASHDPLELSFCQKIIHMNEGKIERVSTNAQQEGGAR